jgi:hypothetical protein
MLRAGGEGGGAAATDALYLNGQEAPRDDAMRRRVLVYKSTNTDAEAGTKVQILTHKVWTGRRSILSYTN